MTGKDMIKWIQDHHCEDYEIVIIRDGIVDKLLYGLDKPDDEDKQIVI